MAELEGPPDDDGADDARDEPEERTGRARGRNGRYPGHDDRRQARRDDDQDDEGSDEEEPPTNGRQLLGWCAHQVLDAKGQVIGYGKKRGFPARIVDWGPDQVDAAFRFARARPDRARR